MLNFDADILYHLAFLSLALLVSIACGVIAVISFVLLRYLDKNQDIETEGGSFIAAVGLILSIFVTTVFSLI